MGVDWIDREGEIVPARSSTRGADGRVRSDEISAVVQQIVERFQPEQVILFGSYAAGTPGSESDVDLLVVMDTPSSEIEQAARICQAIDYQFGLDLLVRTPKSMEHRLALGDPFLHEILNRGTVLYERAGRRVG
jgi:predicted nucleotidyltransferase